MTTQELLKETETMIERLVTGASKETAATRLLYAANLLSGEWELMNSLGDRSRTKTLLTMATRLTIRAGELLGDTSREHQWLKELEDEANAMKADAVGVGR
jgi:ribosomal protein L17